MNLGTCDDATAEAELAHCASTGMIVESTCALKRARNSLWNRWVASLHGRWDNVPVMSRD